MGMVKNEDFKVTKGEDKLKQLQYHLKQKLLNIIFVKNVDFTLRPRSNPKMTMVNLGYVDEIKVEEIENVPVNDG